MKRVAVTQLVNMTKCENQTLLNTIYKPKLANDVKQRQKEGISDHKKFEKLNNKYANNSQRVLSEMNKSSDRRCYVATAIFGNTSPETTVLRKWRDEKLSQYYAGRVFIRVYYKLSPFLLRAMPSCTKPMAKAILTKFVEWIRNKDNG